MYDVDDIVEFIEFERGSFVKTAVGSVISKKRKVFGYKYLVRVEVEDRNRTLEEIFTPGRYVRNLWVKERRIIRGWEKDV